jgi:hypothetical protein
MSAAPLASPADARRFACDSLPLRLGFDFASRVIATPLCRRLVRYDRTCMRLLYVFDNQGSRESRTKVAGAEIMPPLPNLKSLNSPESTAARKQRACAHCQQRFQSGRLQVPLDLLEARLLARASRSCTISTCYRSRSWIRASSRVRCPICGKQMSFSCKPSLADSIAYPVAIRCLGPAMPPCGA